MFEGFRGTQGMFHGVNRVQMSYIFVDVASRTNEPEEMVLHLANIVRDVMKEGDDLKLAGMNGGLAFFNLAKILDEQPPFYKVAAMQSLGHSLEIYRQIGKRVSFDGATRDQIRDYVQNPYSELSLKDVNINIR